MDALDEDELLAAMSSIDVLIAELVKSPKDFWNSITASYSDLYLNRCYILAMRARIPKVWGGEGGAIGTEKSEMEDRTECYGPDPASGSLPRGRWSFECKKQEICCPFLELTTSP